MKKLLIIIPAYNEEANIEKTVHHVQEILPQYDYLVINDGSTDRTPEICRENGFNFLDLPVNLGLTGAFQAGMKYAYKHHYDYAIQYDGDGQHNPEYIEPMLQEAERFGIDIMIGSRFLQAGKNRSLRMLGNSIINLCILLTTGCRIKDSTSGMRLYSARMIKEMALQPNSRPEPDTVAFLVLCGAKVGEYPVHMNERTAGESYLNFTAGIKYMFYMCTSILLLNWFRKKG